MKIGILTFHRALNYGAVLQCFALQEYLKTQGHIVEVIDYRPASIERYRKTFSKYNLLVNKGFINKVKTVILSILTFSQRKVSCNSFDSFLVNHLSLSSFKVSKKSIEGKYDYVIIGSDQVWSPSICFGFDDFYWGNFKHFTTKVITYGASIGGHNILTEQEYTKIRHNLKNFYAISVREKALFNLLRDRFSYNASYVCDPTLLVDKSVFERIAEEPQEDNYILLFNLEHDDNIIAFSKRLSCQLNSKIIKISAEKPYNSKIYIQEGIILKCQLTPSQFLGYFRKAKCVVTISFHATIFSILFKKDFYSMVCSQGDRARNILDYCGLGNRMVQSSDFIQFESIDYTGVNDKLIDYKRKSGQFIKDVLV